QLATIAAQTSDTTKPALDPTLGFVVPNVPRGTDWGSDSPRALAASVHHTATSGEHDIERLLAFSRVDFLVPESLWSQAAKGLKTVHGLPTRDELELALGALRSAGHGASLAGVTPANDLAGDTAYVQVVDFDVAVDSRTDRYRLTAVTLCGRWFVAHLPAIGAEDDARQFLCDLFESQKAFNAYRQGRYAKNLHELAGARAELEKNPNIKLSGLSFPLGSRLDRLEKDKLEWVANDLRGPFYRFTRTGDDKSGWSAVAMPRSQSYWTYSITVTAGSDGKKPEIKRYRASGDVPDAKDG